MSAQSTTETETGGEQPANIVAAADQSRTTDDLYFIRTAETGAVKIGRAWKPKQRMRELQVGNHEEIHPWVVLKGRGPEEKQWHRAFQRWQRRGEWFDFSPQLMTATVIARCGGNWREALEEA